MLGIMYWVPGLKKYKQESITLNQWRWFFNLCPEICPLMGRFTPNLKDINIQALLLG